MTGSITIPETAMNEERRTAFVFPSSAALIVIVTPALVAEEQRGRGRVAGTAREVVPSHR